MKEEIAKIDADVKEKKSHMGLYTLLVACAIFLYLVYSTLQMNDRLDKLDAQQLTIAGHVALLEEGGISTPDVVPFCYGYDQAGNKGFAVDGRKIVTPCEGVNVSQ